ncbi:MAG: hypothetical protein ACOZNI_08495 [Myxococcota bacterium]
MLFLLTLTACPPSAEDDTAKSDDTGATDDTGEPEPTVLDELFAGEPRNLWGCGWGYVVAEYDGATLVAELALPETDRYANADVSYARPLDAGDSLEVGAGAGPDEIQTFDCYDVMEIEEGVQLWTATSGDLALDATFVRDAPEHTCDGVSPNPIYDTHVVLTNLELADARGATATLSAFTADLQLGMNYCGG